MASVSPGTMGGVKRATLDRPAEPVYPSPPVVGGSRHLGWLGAAILLMLGYQAVAHGIFVGRFFALDDFWILADTDRAQGIAGIFAPSHGWLQYRPLTTVGYYAAQRALWGLDPVGWQVVHLLALAVNGVLAWAVAQRLLANRVAALACALVYAAAPGHTLAARWIPYFTVTGVVTVVLCAVWLWLRLPASRRGPAMVVLTVVGLLAGEQAVTLAPVLTLLVLLVEPREGRGRALRALAPVWLLLLAAAGAKLWWGRVVFPRERPGAAAMFWEHYGLHPDPTVALATLGRYARFALSPLFFAGDDDGTRPLVGGVLVVAATLLGLLVLLRRTPGRALRATAFGLTVFVVGIGPVLLMPQHFASAYVGLAAFGLALALIAPLTALPGRAAALAPVLLAGVVVLLHGRYVLPRVIVGPEIRGIEGSARDAAGWLRAIDAAATARPGIGEVVIPSGWANDLTFELGEAHRLFLCAPYRVRTVQTPATEPARPWRAVVTRPDRRDGPPWPYRPCPDGSPGHIRKTP